LPSSGANFGTDSIKAGDLDCSNSVGGSLLFDMGLTGIVNNAVAPIIGKPDPLNPETKQLGIYARIVIPLDAPRQRIECSKLFNLELQARRLEVEKLRQEIELLKSMQEGEGFDN
jgi:hypothetical protein